MSLFEVEKLTEENVCDWVTNEVGKFEEAKNYPKTIFKQYNWWIDFITRVIWSIQYEEQRKEKLK